MKTCLLLFPVVLLVASLSSAAEGLRWSSPRALEPNKTEVEALDRSGAFQTEEEILKTYGVPNGKYCILIYIIKNIEDYSKKKCIKES